MDKIIYGASGAHVHKIRNEVPKKVEEETPYGIKELPLKRKMDWRIENESSK